MVDSECLSRLTAGKIGVAAGAGVGSRQGRGRGRLLEDSVVGTCGVCCFLGSASSKFLEAEEAEN